MMLSVKISTESIHHSEYLSRSVAISLSECDARSARYTKRLRGNAVLYCSLRKGDDVASMPHHPDGVAYATSPSNKV
jgi:hypothetical protein